MKDNLSVILLLVAALALGTVVTLLVTGDREPQSPGNVTCVSTGDNPEVLYQGRFREIIRYNTGGITFISGDNKETMISNVSCNVTWDTGHGNHYSSGW